MAAGEVCPCWPACLGYAPASGGAGTLLEHAPAQSQQLPDLGFVYPAGEVALHPIDECRLGCGEGSLALGGERGVDGPPVC
jgi:hypothetical protein